MSSLSLADRLKEYQNQGYCWNDAWELATGDRGFSARQRNKDLSSLSRHQKVKEYRNQGYSKSDAFKMVGIQ